MHALRLADDQLRTEALEARGWCVLRVTNEAVMGDMGGVLALVADAMTPRAPTRRHL